MATDHRSTTRQLAEFVANRFIRFGATVSSEVNEPGIEEMRRLERERFTPEGPAPPHTGTPLDECHQAPSAIGDYLRLPQIRGSIESFVGANPSFDHYFTHHIRSGSTYTQALHVDAITDSPDPTLDVRLSGTRTTLRPARVARFSCLAATSAECVRPGSTATSTLRVNSSSPVRRAPWSCSTTGRGMPANRIRATVTAGCPRCDSTPRCRRSAYLEHEFVFEQRNELT